MHGAFRSAGVLVLALILAALAVPTAAQREPVDRNAVPELAAATPPYCIGTHDVGQLVMGVTNYGMIGIARGQGSRVDCFTGRPSPKGEYPKGSKTVYLYAGGLWIGGIVGIDTLVTHGAEFNNNSRELHPTTRMDKLSGTDYDDPDYALAVSEQDYLAEYADTFHRAPWGSWDPIANRPHKPLNVKVEQASYAWSYSHTDDIIILTYKITNIGTKRISKACAGLYMDADVHTSGTDVIYVMPEFGKPPTDGKDDLAGFIYSTQSPFELCESQDTIGLAWTADNDGDYKNGAFVVPNIIGMRVLGPDVTDPSLRLSFNWWVYNYNSAYDFGPQRHDQYRDLGNGPGTPYGDRNKYFLMNNGERDYDMVYTKLIGQNDMTWAYPNPRSAHIMTVGADVQQVLAIGPRDVAPGASFEFAVAIVGGEKFHVDPYNHRTNLARAYQPEQYYENVDFSGIIRNAITAGRVYDIPGFDSNDDGYGGKFRVCVFDSAFIDGQWVSTVADTAYYEGDGIPDFEAAAPPPSPDFWLTPIRNGISVRFNGVRSENVRDVFSGDMDFEGYRVYISRDNREESFSVVAQYDRENYEKYVYTRRLGREPGFLRVGNPMTVDDLRCLYGGGENPCLDSTFSPDHYTASHPYIHQLFPDSIFYFAPHDYNQSEFGAHTSIRKVYPDQPVPTSIQNPQEDELTEEGRLKYYEYEVAVTDLLPSVPYYVSVTAFDYGSPQAGLAPLESSRTLNSQTAYPNNVWDEKPDSLTNVYVYPNPYRHDAFYRIIGLEGRSEENRSRDRVRKITFANLPAKCTISIFTLDGDLVREINHDMSPSDPNAPYEVWDMVTRNIQMVVSGLYYWVVETPDGQRQIGKLAILM